MRPQVCINRIAHLVWLAFPRKIEMRYLPECVHARVGTASALQSNSLAGKGRDRRNDQPLHRRTVVLNLPSDTRRAVIFDGYFVAWHFDPSQTGKSRRY